MTARLLGPIAIAIALSAAGLTGQDADRLWIDSRGGPTADAVRMLDRLANAADDGLDAEDYDAVQLIRQAEALTQAELPSPVDARAFDARLTDSALRYMRHLHLGRVAPRDLDFHLDHALEPHDFPAMLRSALASRAIDRMVAALRPSFVQYQGLQRALSDYRVRDPVRARQIELALERLRWLPDFAGERLIVVNLPMYYLWGWEADRAHGVPAIAMPVIIGQAGATDSPIFSAAMTSIVVNPSWHVPDSIVRNEILPAIARDPDYLTRHHMELTSTGGIPRVRQLPGPWNALGPLKFSLPNTFSVYLHGTPAPELFDRPRRDFSHGCVRVADSVALAEWVLHGQGAWTRARIVSAIDSGVTRTVRIARPTRVVVFYVTATFDPDENAVRFADDIYGHDVRLDAWLRASRDRGE